jgi:pimeloyl-ACP methyl ester carboxylesterase
VAREGHGEPIILLHGWLRSRQEWATLLPFIRGPRELISLDLPCFGDSDVVPGNCELPFFVRRVVGVLDALKLKKVKFLGHGLGGAVALQLAHEQPERVSWMGLLSPSGWPRSSVATEATKAGLIRGPLGRMYFELMFNRHRCRAMLVQSYYSDATRVDDALLSSIYRPWCRPGAREVLHRSLATAFNPRISLVLETLKTPTLAIWGSEDRVHPLALGERFAKEKPATKLEVIQGGDYMALETSPKEVASRLLSGGL